MSFLDAIKAGVCTVPGNGCISFSPIFNALAEGGYQGWFVVEAEQAVKKIVGGESQIELMPQGSFIRKIQHQIAQNSSVVSTSTGKEPNRRVVFYKQ